MSKIDGGLRAEFRRYLRPPDWELTPVESGGTVSGIPDTFWSHVSGRYGWIEMKQTDGWAVDVRPHQVGWLRRHAARGVRCALAIRVNGAGSARGVGDGLWLGRGSAAALVAASGVPRAFGDETLGAWYGEPRDWDWAEVARLLLS